MKRSIVAAAVGSLVAVALVGCATPAATKDVVSNPVGHLATFAPTVLKPEVIAKMPKGEPDLGFKRMVFDIESSEARADEQRDRDQIKAKYTFVNVGNGLVQTYDEIRSNDVPFRINYRLSYRGLMPLKWQNVFHAKGNADVAYEVKEVKRVDPVVANLVSGRAMEFEGSTGMEPQVAGFQNMRRACTVNSGGAATELHSSLQGRWQEITCDSFGGNGAVLGKASYAYLTHYGVAYIRTYADSRARHTNRIVGVRVE